MDYKLLIDDRNGNIWDVTETIDQVQLKTKRVGSCGTLTFSMARGDAFSDSKFQVSNGNTVHFYYKGEGIFSGNIFKIERDIATGSYNITCYDQIKYLMYNTSYCFLNQTASQMLSRIAAEFKINTGIITDTEFIIPRHAKKDKKILDIINEALDLTMDNTGKLYCLYDAFGALNLQEASELITDLVIAPTANLTGGSYSTDIEESYNQFVLVRDYKEEEVNEDQILLPVKPLLLEDLIQQWGILQYFETVEEGLNQEQILQKQEQLSKRYGRENQTLSVETTGAFVRAGSSIGLVIPSLSITQNFLIEEASHTWAAGQDFQSSLTLKMA